MHKLSIKLKLIIQLLNIIYKFYIEKVLICITYIKIIKTKIDVEEKNIFYEGCQLNSNSLFYDYFLIHFFLSNTFNLQALLFIKYIICRMVDYLRNEEYIFQKYCQSGHIKLISPERYCWKHNK